MLFTMSVLQPAQWEILTLDIFPAHSQPFSGVS